MAGDWIKWTKGLAKKPEVIGMSSILGRSRHEIAGLLMELWEWTDDNVMIDDKVSGFDPDNCPGFVRLVNATSERIDELSGIDGFAGAMQNVGWLHIERGILVFPNFGRHNGKSAKARALDQNRKKSQRKKPSGKKPDKRPVSNRTKSGLETETEREKYPPYPPNLDNEKFKQAWSDYEAYRKENRIKPLSVRSIKTQWQRLSEWGCDVAIESIRLSIANGWQGLFDPRGKTPMPKGADPNDRSLYLSPDETKRMLEEQSK